ncbi:cwf18 pre-mRNA splicing factor [Gregarina niphandrodes]|uniref:Cwf18 pre-mRNA splicing factor n=1 Tax=Gregarina niphandrodes TaxID=110365 RepID=A0A023B9I6_GRENI|nr:cwf18 pre-mRNA splicing factor [Gregarina niphandrodes]EZG72994.1 cwf18 pre-mRNA splicing factor [Gregarina niphandrodes]|eukprot:XP_011129689.1 cwf18 pre-mRNA splicing factor [Gregarina niphandrodes]
MLQFRTYIPQDPGLRRYCKPDDAEHQLKNVIDSEIEHALEEADNQDFYKLIKPAAENADLKRDLKAALKSLDGKTQKKLQQLRRAAS